MSPFEVSVIIVNHNTRDLLRQSLLSLNTGMRGLTYEVWVVDNASADGSREMTRNEFPEVKLIENSENSGFAKANNQALRLMKGRAALLLNSDAMLEPGAGKTLADFLQKNPHAGMVGPALLDAERNIRPSTYPLPGLLTETLRSLKLHLLLPKTLKSKLLLGSYFDHKTSVKAGRLTGACVMVPRTVMEELGLMSEDFFFYGEIHDWCWSMQEEGWEVWFCPDAAAVHLGGQSSKHKWDAAAGAIAVLEASDRMLRRHVPVLKIKLLYAVTFTGNILSLFYRKFRRGGDDEAGTRRLVAETRWYFLELFRY